MSCTKTFLAKKQTAVVQQILVPQTLTVCPHFGEAGRKQTDLQASNDLKPSVQLQTGISRAGPFRAQTQSLNKVYNKALVDLRETYQSTYSLFPPLHFSPWEARGSKKEKNMKV